MAGEAGDEHIQPSARQKLSIFTEHRDTLNYLHEQIGKLLGRPEAVVTIHGGMGARTASTRKRLFKHDPDVQVLIATDAAGEASTSSVHTS